MASGYELSEEPWSRIQDLLLPGRQESVGRTAADHRVFVNGVLWVWRSGARGSDGPERYGKDKSVPKRSPRGAATRVGDRIFRSLTQHLKNESLWLDSTLVRARQPAATGRKKGG